MHYLLVETMLSANPVIMVMWFLGILLIAGLVVCIISGQWAANLPRLGIHFFVIFSIILFMQILMFGLLLVLMRENIIMPEADAAAMFALNIWYSLQQEKDAAAIIIVCLAAMVFWKSRHFFWESGENMSVLFSWLVGSFSGALWALILFFYS